MPRILNETNEFRILYILTNTLIGKLHNIGAELTGPAKPDRDSILKTLQDAQKDLAALIEFTEEHNS